MVASIDCVTAADVEAFRRDGAVCLRGVLSSTWMDVLAAAVEQVMANPGRNAKFADHDRRGFFQDTDNWRRIPLLQDFVWKSPAAAVASALLGSPKINFLQDHVLVKEPNTEKPTLWHQDQPYSPVDGDGFLTMWIAIDPVPLERSLRFVRGSHGAGRWYRPRHFSTGGLRDGDDPRWSVLPDVDALPDDFPQIAWGVVPGDIVAFHGLTLHGAPGNLSSSQRRRVLSLRWTGEDARFALRDGPMSPSPPQDEAPAPGGPLDCRAFPVVLSA
jgi:ectoine hydroxylase-related dioxygenase (phytanoyl-CoA dioxygenase family)